MRLTAKQVIWLKVCLHLAGLLPFLWLVWAINHGGLGADPVKDIQHFTGRTALKFLLAALLITPLARYAKQPVYEDESPKQFPPELMYMMCNVIL